MTTWHMQNVRAWSAFVGPLLPDSPVRWLEIGSHEGASAAWVLDELLRDGDSMTCVDPWPDAKAEAMFDAAVGGRVEKVKARSQDWLPKALAAGRRFDVVYVDGDHDASSVIADAVMAWQMLRRGGVLLFDDYRWIHPGEAIAKTPPAIAIDAFLEIFRTQIVLLHASAGVVVWKRREGPHDMRKWTVPGTRGSRWQTRE